MRRSTKKLLTYGALAAGAYYMFFRQPAPAPTVANPPAPGGPVAGFGYFPSGSDTPFARIYRGQPTAWYKTHNW